MTTARVPRELLDISNLDEVNKLLKKHHYSGAKLYELGLSLGLLAPTLDVIKANNVNNASGYLLECLSAWLRKADKVASKDGPTYVTLIAALRSIGENAVADAIDREKHPACMILADHHSTLLKIIQRPFNVAELLHKELVLSEEALAAVKSTRRSQERKKALLKAVQETVCYNHQNLETFANLLRQEFSAAVPVADAILREYEVYFTDDNEVELVSDEDNCIPEESSGSSNATNEKASNQIFVPRRWRREFNEMRMEFGSMFSNVRTAIRQHSPPIPIDDIKEHLGDCFPHLSKRLRHARSLFDILKIVREMCTLIDISILEGIVSQFNIKEAEIHIQKYKESIATFCGKVKVLLCVKEVFDVVKGPSRLRRETTTILLGWNAEDHILDDVRDFIGEGLGEEMIISSVRTTKSIEVTCFFPVSSTAMLIARAHANLTVLKEKGLLQLTIGYYTVYDSSKDEVRELKEENMQIQHIENDQDIIMSLRLQLQEEEKKNQQLTEEIQVLKSQLQSQSRSVNKSELTEQQELTNEQRRELQPRQLLDTPVQILMAKRGSSSPVHSSSTWLDQRPILRIVCAVVRTSRWHQLGIQLELDTAKLEDIKKESTTTQKKREQMFQLWLDTQPSASNRQLLHALKLKVIGEDTMADEYKREAMSHVSPQESFTSCTDLEEAPTSTAVTAMTQEASRVLSIKALQLQDRYYELLMVVQKNAQQEGNVEIMKSVIRHILQEKLLYQLQAIRAYRQAIDRATTVDDVFKFLVENHFVGYLNYNLLKRFSNEEICGAGSCKAKEKVIEYEKHFFEFIEEPAFSQLINVFDNNPHLNPSTVVGLPIIVISLEERWVHRTNKELQDWIPFLKENKVLLQSMGYKCILITYAIFPVDLLNILNFLNDPDQIELLSDNGITIDEVPSDTLSMAAELRKANTVETQPGKAELEIENNTFLQEPDVSPKAKYLIKLKHQRGVNEDEDRFEVQLERNGMYAIYEDDVDILKLAKVKNEKWKTAKCSLRPLLFAKTSATVDTSFNSTDLKFFL